MAERSRAQRGGEVLASEERERGRRGSCGSGEASSQSPRLCCLLTIPPRVHRRSRRRRWALRLLDTGVGDGNGTRGRRNRRREWR